MRVGNALLELGGFLEESERRTGVIAVDVPDCIDASDPDRTNATVELTLSLDESSGNGDPFSLYRTDIRSDGTVRLGLETGEPIFPESDYDVGVEPIDASFNGDGTVTLTLSLFTGGGDRSWGDVEERTEDPEPRGGTAADGGTTVDLRERDVPPFEDTELLADIYGSCDTFGEMAQELDMDVTAETVRRYMVDHDIHEPNSYDTSTGENDEEADTCSDSSDRATEPHDSGEGPNTDPAVDREASVMLTDGIGLPDDVTVETLIETVRRSNTIYEFKREVGIERDRAQAVLRELNLLEFFAGRLDSDVERDIEREEVIERLREASARQ